MNAPTPSAAVAINQTIAIELLAPSPTNPRKRFDETKLNELAESIKTQGVLQPLLVRKISAAPAKRPSATWPFPEPKKYELAEKLYAERIAAGQAAMPGEGDDGYTPGVKAALQEIKNATAASNNNYEIVAGERRYRAAKLAGLTELPCFVRELTDLQVLHAQVIENLQRDDLHPLEEAEGYERLIELGSKAEELGAEIGKSRAYIYGRLKLCALAAEARKAFYDGLLDASTALLIARIPVDKMQVQATRKITVVNNYTGRAMSYREARDLLQREYMTDLDDAPFPIKDAALLPKAGSCTDCTKRTGNQPELFDDVGSKDVCTDTVCFAMKKTAHILAIHKKAEDEGCLVITGKKAKEIIKTPSWGSKAEPAPESGYVRLDSVCPYDPEKRTWEKTLGKKAFKPAEGTAAPDVQKIMVENTHTHELIPTVNIEQAVKVLREAGMEITLKGASKKPGPQQDTAATEAKVKQINLIRSRLFDALHDHIEADLNKPQPYFADGLYRMIAEYMFDSADYRDKLHLAKRYMPDMPISEKTRHEDERKLRDKFAETIPAMTTQQQVLLLVDLLMIEDIEADTWSLKVKPETMLAIAAEIGIDAAAIEKEAIAEVKAAAKKPTAGTSSTPTTAAPAGKKAAQKKS